VVDKYAPPDNEEQKPRRNIPGKRSGQSHNQKFTLEVFSIPSMPFLFSYFSSAEKWPLKSC